MASIGQTGQRGDGYLYQRGPTYWLGYYHNGKYLRESLRTTDQKTAERRRREKLKLTNTQHFVAPDQRRVSFDDIAALYISDFQNNGRRSLRDAERIVKQLRTVYGTDRALAITSDRIEAYKTARLSEKKAKATVNRELSALRRMFSLAVRSGRLTWRPTIQLLDESDNVREGFFEPSDFEAVCKHLQSDLAEAATFAYFTGWRRGEVVSLEWKRVTLGADRGTILLPPARSKNKKPRVVVLTGELLALLRKRSDARQLACPYVFHRQGKALRDFRTSWRNACEAAGFAGRLFHDLRRSAVRNMIRAQVPEKVAMCVSGHETRSVFDRYNIVSEDDIAAALDRTTAYVNLTRHDAPRVQPLHPTTHISRTPGGLDHVEPSTPSALSA